MSTGHRNYCWGKVQWHEMFLCTGGSKQILPHLQNFSHSELSNQCNNQIAEAACFFLIKVNMRQNIIIMKYFTAAEMHRLFSSNVCLVQTRTEVSDCHDFNSISVKIKTTM